VEILTEKGLIFRQELEREIFYAARDAEESDTP
jgi:hypothetical protein